MSLSSAMSRVTGYYKRHGLAATMRRAALAARRTVFSNRSILFYCDLSRLPAPPDFPKFLTMERKRAIAEISPENFQQIIEVWQPKLARQLMEDRFARGASLWLIKSEDRLAGYGWTLHGGMITPYYFPLGKYDVQFFDFHIFRRFRGRAIDWFLMTHVLHMAAADGATRAYAEAGEWNQASLSSIRSTAFQEFGSARKLSFLRRTIVLWDEVGISRQRQSDVVYSPRALKTEGANSD